MKGYTSRDRFDEERRFVAVNEEMGRARLDADANEQALISLTDARRRSGDVAEGSPDDGFRLVETFVVDAITSTDGWTAAGLPPGDERVIPPELRLERRDPETLPHVLRTRGNVAVRRRLPRPLDLLRLPEPGHHSDPDATWRAEALHVPLRIDRRANDDEIVDTRLIVRDEDETWHEVTDIAVLPPDGSGDVADQSIPASSEGVVIAIPLASLDPLARGGGANRTVRITGWGVAGLPPRAETDIGTLVARPADLGDDLVIRGGGGTAGTAGRLYADGRRAFISADWRYSTQPYLPSPAPLDRPGPGETLRTVMYADIVDREVHGWQDGFIAEPAMDGDPTTFRRQQVVQVRALPLDAAGAGSGRLPALPTPTSDGRLTTAIEPGVIQDRTPPEEPDRCRERCLYTEEISAGEGYLGSVNAHVRVEVLGVAGTARRAIVWSRDNAALAAPLTADLPADGVTLTVDSFHAARFQPGDVVTLEDRASRLDPADDRHHPVVRRLRAVDTATGRLELEPAGHLLADDPVDLDGGGPAGRPLLTAEGAAVRRWVGADGLVTDVRYRLVDNITFAFSGSGFRPAEYWTFTARVVAPDARSQGVVERREDVPPDGPHHVRVPLALVAASRANAGAPVVRDIVDLRRRFLPLAEVRDRLIELGARHLAPGAFTVVIGDGHRTFGDIDQNLAEGVTGDEAIHAALAELNGRGGTIYLRAGTYVLEHPVVLQRLSDVRILGDGAATRLEVRGAGGAFVLDDCGWDGTVSLELMDLIEVPEAAVPIGEDGDGISVGDLVPADDGGGALGPGDLVAPGGGLSALLDGLTDRFVALTPRLGRASASVVATILQLRRLQRARPGRPLEEVAPDQLDTLRRLPHGVVTVGDCGNVRLQRLGLDSDQRAPAAGTVGAGVLMTGTLHDIVVAECRVRAAAGVVATSLGRFLSAAAFIQRPRSGLYVRGVRIVDNDLAAGSGGGTVGVRIADGDVEGVTVDGNEIEAFVDGIVLEDRAEVRHGEPMHHTSVRENRVRLVAGIGIDVRADGAEVADNEVRLASSTEEVRAGIRLAGSNNRVSGGTVSMPRTDGGASAFDLEAGVIVGLGVDDGGTLARLVNDVVVQDLHVTGVGASTVGHGIFVGGASPIRGVRLSRCRVRAVGGAGVRAMGHGAAISDVLVDACEIGDVAGHDLRWGAEVAGAAADLVPGVGGGSPARLLEAILDAPRGRIVRALDGVLRWTESATLRGGVVLSLVDEGTVRDSVVRGVGSRHLVTSIAGTDVHVAGIALVGGEQHRVEANRVSGVQAPVRTTPVVVPPVRPRPGLLDLLDRLPQTTFTPAADLHGAVVGLRSLVHRYAIAPSDGRQQLGYRIYGAMEAVQDGLASRGAQASKLATGLADAIEVMRSAQNYDDHTTAANQVRTLASQAAELTAPDPATGEAWGYAHRLDRVIDTDRSTLAAVAQDIVDAAPSLMEGLGLGVDLAEVARAVIAAGAGEVLDAAQVLAGELGRVATARRRAPEAGKGVLLSGRQSTLLSTVLENVERQLPDGSVRDVNRDLVEGLSQGVDALTDALRDAQPDLAQTIRSAYERLRRAGGAPPAGDVDALRGALAKAKAFLDAPEQGVTVDDADAEAEQEVADGELVMLTTDWIDRRLASLASADEASETRSLSLLRRSAGQLQRLVAGHPDLEGASRDVGDALELAEHQPADRAEHTRRAAGALRQLRAAQSRMIIASTPLAPVAVDDETDGRLAALTQLIGDLSSDDGREDRAAGATALVGNLRSVVADGVDLPDGERRALLDELDGVERPLAAAGSGVDRRRALHRSAGVMARVADAAAEQRGTADAFAVATLAKTMHRGLAPTESAAGRLAGAHAVVESAQGTVSASTASGLLAAVDIASLNERLVVDLGSLTGVLPRPFPRPQPPAEVVTPLPADGILAAQVDARVGIAGNTVEGGRRGIVVGGAAAHPLAPLDRIDRDGAVDVVVEGNLVRGSVVSAITVDVDLDVRVRVRDNDVQSCGGAPTTEDAPAPGRGIIEVRGRGHAALAGNRLEGNGSTQHPGVIHAVVVRFDGDVSVRGNRVRHHGGQDGGAGLVVTQGTIPADGTDDDRSWDFAALCTEPFLSVDPPPLQRIPLLPRLPFLPTLPVRATELLAQPAPTHPPGGAVTALSQPVRSLSPAVSSAVLTGSRPPALSLLTVTEQLLAPPSLADQLATGWLVGPAEPEVDVVPDLRPLLDFLVRPQIPLLPLPPLRITRTLDVSGNDVLVRGPALLAFGNRIVVLRVSVTGNTLTSTGVTGAAYLRDVDSGVVVGNRVESPSAVTVVLVRARNGLHSISGNALTGREPPTRHRPPVVPRPGGVRPVPPKVTLGVDLGEELGGQVSLALDPERVLTALRGERESSAANAAATASASFTAFATERRITTNPRAAAVLETATRVGVIGVDLDKLVVSPELRNLPVTPITIERRPTGPISRAESLVRTGVEDVGALSVDAASADAAFETAAEPASPTELKAEVTRLTADFDTILRSPDISPATKLFGLAKSGGLPDAGAKALVQQQLLRNNGDELAALQGGLGVLTGVQPPEPAKPTGPVGLPLLESLLGPALGDAELAPIDPLRPGGVRPTFPGIGPFQPGVIDPIGPGVIGPGVIGPGVIGPGIVDPGVIDPGIVRPRPLPRPPAPGRHTLVVLGGAQVALAGNATTAGAYVEPTDV